MSTHIQRLETCLAGKTPDRAPVALWRHFPVDDQDPESLAAASLAWQKTYDWDLVKVTPASSFCLKDWGVDDAWEGDSEGTRHYTKRIISSVEDWGKLKALKADAPHLAAQIKCLKLIRKELPKDTPLVQTIFSPLAQAKNLVGGDLLIAHIRQDPEAVKHGLSIIAETTRNFIATAIQTGIDGIFYAVQHAQAQLLTREEFADFGDAFDIPVLESASSLWLNLLHLHGENVYFDLVADYPVQVINWHDRDTQPSLATAQGITRAAVCGGLRRESMVYSSAEEIQREAADALQQTGGKKFILGTGCVVPIIAPHGNLLAARKSVEK